MTNSQRGGDRESKCFVIDEWLLHDLGGENGPDHQRKSFQFVEKMFEVCDRLATKRASKFESKLYQLVKSPNLTVRNLGSYLLNRFIFNSTKCETLDHDYDVPQSLRSAVNQDDLYLLECFFALRAETLVTTDKRLIDALSGQPVATATRDDFVKEYLKGEE